MKNVYNLGARTHRFESSPGPDYSQVLAFVHGVLSLVRVLLDEAGHKHYKYWNR